MGKSLRKILALMACLGAAAPAVASAEEQRKAETYFEYDNKSYMILDDKNIACEENGFEYILDENGNWRCQQGNYMSKKFLDEAKKALNFAREKQKRGITAIDHFVYTSPVTKDKNVFVRWSDHTISMGPYLYSDRWFYDKNENGIFDNGDEYMNDLFNSTVNERLKFSELEQKTQSPNLDNNKSNPYFSIIAGANSNIAFNNFGGSIGARYNFNDIFGVGALLDVSLGLDEQIDSYSGPLSAERVASGTVTNSNIYSLGLSAEMQLGPFIAGAGVDYSSWIKNVLEQISKGDEILKSNTNSIINGQFFAKVYGGLEIEPVKGWKVGAMGGYDWKNGPFFSIRNNFRLGK